MLEIKYINENLITKLPSWWFFLSEIGLWAKENKGCYVCIVAPDDVYSSLSLLSSFIEVRRKPTEEIIRDIKAQPFCYLKDGDKWYRAKFIDHDIEMKEFYNFEMPTCIKKIRRSDLLKVVTCVRKEVVQDLKKPWVTSIRRDYKVEDMQTVANKFVVYGNKTKLYEAINRPSFNLEIYGGDCQFSMGNLLGVDGCDNESVGNENVFIRSYLNAQKEDADLEIWAGITPYILPEENSSVIMVLRASDPELEDKVTEFLSLRRQKLGRRWKSIIRNEDITCERLKEIIYKKPNSIGISAYKYIKE